MAVHVVKQGECIESIAFSEGFLWETLWDHPDNAALKEERKNPNTLLPGDQVSIPEKAPKSESVDTGCTHQFKRKCTLSPLRVRFLDEGEPISDSEYTLEAGDLKRTGSTDSDGWLDEQTPPTVNHASVSFDVLDVVFDLEVGALDPLPEMSGIKGRLYNLGYEIDEIDDPETGPDLSEAMKRFQRANDLEVTGELDDESLGKLEEVHVS